MANSADPDQLASEEANFQKPTDLDLHCLQRHGISRLIRTRLRHMGTPDRMDLQCLQRQGISWFSRTRVKI